MASLGRLSETRGTGRRKQPPNAATNLLYSFGACWSARFSQFRLPRSLKADTDLQSKSFCLLCVLGLGFRLEARWGACAFASDRVSGGIRIFAFRVLGLRGSVCEESVRSLGRAHVPDVEVCKLRKIDCGTWGLQTSSKKQSASAIPDNRSHIVRGPRIIRMHPSPFGQPRSLSEAEGSSLPFLL